MNQQQVMAELQNVTGPTDAKYYFVTPAQAALRPPDRPEAAGWHAVISMEDGGVLFRRKFVLTPTNPIAILAGLNGPIIHAHNAHHMMKHLSETEHKLRGDVAFWRVMQREK